MIKITDAIKNHHNGTKEKGSAMIFAILLSIIVLSVLTLMSTSAVVTSETSRTSNIRESLKNAAENGVNSALYEANNNASVDWLTSKKGTANAWYLTSNQLDETMPGIKVRIYTAQVPNSPNWYIYSTGYTDAIPTSSKKAVTLRVMVEGVAVSTGKYDSANNKVTYSISPDSAYAYGIMGIASVEFAGTSKIYTDNSTNNTIASGTTITGTEAATNGTATLATASHGLLKLTTSTPGAGVGCLGECSMVSSAYRTALFSLSAITESVNSACPLTTYPAWVASANSGVLNPANGTCYSSMTFDQNTTIPTTYNATTPLRIYVKGAVTVNNGINVNQTSKPTSLVIRSSAGNFTTGTTTGAISMLYASEAATCTIQGSTIFYGGLACNKTIMKGASRTYYDLALKGTGLTGVRKVWKIISSEEM